MIIYIIGVVMALSIILIARKPRPVPDRQGLKFNPSDQTSERHIDKKKNTLTVASFNVQTGKNLQGQRDITRAAKLLQYVDLAGIQEVYAQNWSNKLGLGISQTQLLASIGQFDWLFCPTRYRWFRENRGNAILSKLPIFSWQTTMLPDQTGISFRNMTVIQFQWQNQDCHFINTHLHTTKGKSEQLRDVLSEFDRYPRAILVGDFNCTPDTVLLSDFFASSDATDAILYCNADSNENNRIDWIITKGWKINSGKMIEKGVSDHPYYEINLELLAQ